MKLGELGRGKGVFVVFVYGMFGFSQNFNNFFFQKKKTWFCVIHCLS